MVYIPDSDKHKIEHVVRPLVPWRTASLTECGKDADKCDVISREKFLAKVRNEGKTRAAMTTCMTCYETALRHPTWEEDPGACIERDVGWHRGKRKEAVNREFRALAALVGRHRAEFDELMRDVIEIVPMESARSMRLAPKPRGDAS